MSHMVTRINYCVRLLSSLRCIHHVDSTDDRSYVSVLATAMDAFSSSGTRKIDVLMTDPPYCILERRRNDGSLRDKKKTQRVTSDHVTVPRYKDIKSYDTFTNKWLSLTISRLTDDATILIWTNPLGKATIVKNLHQHSYKLTGEYVWAKHMDKFSSANSVKNEYFLRVNETCLIFHKENSTKMQHVNIDTLPWIVKTNHCTTAATTAANTSDGIDNSIDNNFMHHPCMKPLDALTPLIKLWTKEDDVIFDPFAGTGNILKACQLHRRMNVIGFEILPEWVKYSNNSLSIE